MAKYIPFERASEGLKKQIVNGIGPDWMPASMRRILTKISSSFFSEADWGHHDWGYFWGYPERSVCDFKFLQAMLRDASRMDRLVKIIGASILAWFFYVMVRSFGWISYNHKGCDSVHISSDD